MKVNKNWFFSQAARLAKTDMFSFKQTKSQLDMFLCPKWYTHRRTCIAWSHTGISQIDVSGSSEAIYFTIMPLYESNSTFYNIFQI